MPPPTNAERLESLSPEELREAIDRATHFAESRIGTLNWQGVIDDTSRPLALTAADLVQEAFEKVIMGAKWDEEKPLWLILKGILRGRTNHLAEALENSTVQDAISPEAHDVLLEVAVQPPAALNQDTMELFLLSLEDHFKDDPDCIAVIKANVWDGLEKRSEVAKHTGLSAEDVTNAKRRWERALPEFRAKFYKVNGIEHLSS